MDEQTEPCVLFIVEDDDDERLLLSYELQDNGLEKGACYFSNIHELVERINARERQSLPALILLDAFLPVVNVRDSVALIKGVEGLSTVPLVVLLGSTLEKDYLRSFNLNVSGYIEKPINAKLLKRFLKVR